MLTELTLDNNTVGLLFTTHQAQLNGLGLVNAIERVALYGPLCGPSAESLLHQDLHCYLDLHLCPNFATIFCHFLA